MKSRKKYNLGLIVLLFLLLYGSSIGVYLNSEDDYVYETAVKFGTIQFVVVSVIMMIVPLIYRLANNELLDLEKGKKICKWNSIILFVVSTFLYISANWNFIGGIGAIFYYFINMNLFVGDEKANSESIRSQKATTDGYYKCDNCGVMVAEQATECPNCGATFVDEITEQEIIEQNVDQKYSDLKKLKELLDAKIITQAEFNKEKKKILNK